MDSAVEVGEVGLQQGTSRGASNVRLVLPTPPFPPELPQHLALPPIRGRIVPGKRSQCGQPDRSGITAVEGDVVGSVKVSGCGLKGTGTGTHESADGMHSQPRYHCLLHILLRPSVPSLPSPWEQPRNRQSGGARCGPTPLCARGPRSTRVRGSEQNMRPFLPPSPDI